MKAVVYTICKHEAKHIHRFMDSCEGADEVVILDTGSTDNSVRLLQKRGATVHEAVIDPWRFDVARNMNLSFVPDDTDVCLCIDLDEVLKAGWREELERCWCRGVTRINYWYCEGGGDNYYRHHKMHTRRGYVWRHAVHEELVPIAPENQCWTDVKVNHYPDHTKGRTSYYPLLLDVVRENPDLSRFHTYLLIECMNMGKLQEAIDWGERSLELEGWCVHRSRINALMADCHHGLDNSSSEEDCRIRSVIETPEWRDPWFQLALFFNEIGKYPQALKAATMALSLEECYWMNYTDLRAWNGDMYHVAAMAAVNAGQREEAEKFFNRGIIAYPDHADLAKDYGEFLS